MTVADTLAKAGIKLEDTAPGRRYVICPRCSPTRSSNEHRAAKVLGVTIEAGGGVRWGCNHCNWTGPEKGSGERPELQSYIYRDADGAERFRKVRNLPGREPRFWLEQPDGRGGWKKGTKGVDTKILYRLDEVKKAIGEGRIITCVEGEKDCDNLWALGIAATCNAHGASEPGKKPKWTKAHSEQLAGADLVVLNDNDPAGYEHADATCKLSLGIAKRVRWLDLAPHWPEIPKGGDVSDWLAAGHNGDELRELIEAAPDYAAAADPADDKPADATTDDDAELTRLAKLPLLDYERARKDAGKRLGISRLSLLDALVKGKRAELGLDDDDGKQGHAIEFPEPEPWPEPVNGAALLDAIATAVRRHVVMADHARDAAALWVVHTYLVDRLLVSPRLGVCSPTKGCGKTLLLDVLGRLVLRPLPTANVTPAAIFRVIEAHRPCLLIDEGDTFLREADELRGVLNSGHRKGGSVLRTVGDSFEPRAFGTFSACVIAAIGSLPDTLHDRAVVVDLKRRLPSELVEPFRPDRVEHLDVLARKVARWAVDHADRVADGDPAMPAGIINRAADNWRPLLAIADAAGAHWPQRARAAAEQARLTAGADDASRLEALLGDIRDSFGERAEIASADLVEALVGIEGHPWAEMGKGGKPLSQARLARLLRPLGIGPGQIGPETARLRGYVREHFKEAFDRYLSPVRASKVSSRPERDEQGTSEISKVSSPDNAWTLSKCEKPSNDAVLDTWTLPQGGTEAKGPSSAGNGLGLPPRTVEEVARRYIERAAEMRADGQIDQAGLDKWLRRILGTEHQVRPEHADIEVERVMDAVFRV